MDRQVEVYHPPKTKLVLRETDEYLADVDMVLAQCYYCHDSYISVPASEYARFVVYNCGCHKESWVSDDLFLEKGPWLV